ncbi:MAG: hypothetical protein JWN43_4790 [Gammaproteobacteria bacterium]|nr:hypothetical protein [Gammaproteobacteria bacterium]
MSLMLAIHTLGAVVWVGGMFFAYVILRPSAGPLDTATRLSLWQRVFGRFFLWVWLSLAALLLSGIAMVLVGFGGFALLPAYVRIMMMQGVAMTVIYAFVYFVPWQRFRLAVSATDWPAGAKALNLIRVLVAVNGALGLLTVVVATAGRYYP